MAQTVKQVYAYNARDPGLIPGSGRSPGEGNGNPLQYSCLGNRMDGGAWRAAVHGVAQSGTGLSDQTHSRLREMLVLLRPRPLSCQRLRVGGAGRCWRVGGGAMAEGVARSQWVSAGLSAGVAGLTPANEEELSPAAVSSVQTEVRKQEKRQWEPRKEG